MPGLAFEKVVVEVSEGEDTRRIPVRDSAAETLQVFKMIILNPGIKALLLRLKVKLVIVHDQGFPAFSTESGWICTQSFSGAVVRWQSSSAVSESL